MSFIKNIFSPPKPRLPAVQPAPPPPPARAGGVGTPEPAIAAAGVQQRKEELRRRGRRSLIRTSAAGVTDEATLGRPAATLGG